MKKTQAALLMLSLVGASSFAVADNNHFMQGTGFYVNIQGGASVLPQLTFESNSFLADLFSDPQAKSRFDVGGNILASVGYRWNNWRADFTVGAIQNTFDQMNLSGVFSDNGKYKSEGKLKAFPYLINGYYDINTHSRFIPYVGLGLGGMHLEADGQAKNNDEVKLAGHDNAFAGQGILGLAYQVTNNLRFDANYHYLAAIDSGGFSLNTNSNSSSSIDDLSANYSANLFNVGLTWMFNG